MRSKQPKGMSPKHVRKSHLVRSSGNDDPIFCETTFDKYYSMSPSSMNSFRDDTRGKLDHLDAEAAAAETNATSVGCLALRRVRVRPTPPPARP